VTTGAHPLAGATSAVWLATQFAMAFPGHLVCEVAGQGGGIQRLGVGDGLRRRQGKVATSVMVSQRSVIVHSMVMLATSTQGDTLSGEVVGDHRSTSIGRCHQRRLVGDPVCDGGVQAAWSAKSQVRAVVSSGLCVWRWAAAE
jgi:hypothetical protein